MTEKTVADLLATIRFIVGQVVPILTAIGVVATGWYAYRNKVVGDRATGQLSGKVAEVATKVDEVAQAVAPLVDQDAALRSRVMGLPASLQAIRDEPGPGGS